MRKITDADIKNMESMLIEKSEQKEKRKKYKKLKLKLKHPILYRLINWVDDE